MPGEECRGLGAALAFIVRTVSSSAIDVWPNVASSSPSNTRWRARHRRRRLSFSWGTKTWGKQDLGANSSNDPGRGIVGTYRRLGGISTRPDDHSTLTRQSVNMNGDPQGPASQLSYMKSFPYTALLYATSTSMSTATSKNLFIAAAVTITVSTAPLRQDPANFQIIYPTLSPS